ncbi:MAG: hypothetical protein K2M17_04475, partial [Bacilli bacterium]|nr:hypothetical protein [Bacilli bacterium]
ILTHYRVIQEEFYKIFSSIDLLVIDEVYKLETDKNDDRVLVLNMAYYYLAHKAKKYILLAPFIKNIDDIELLEKKPYFYHTEYSPVVNHVEVKELINASDRLPQCQKLINELNSNEKTLIYFPTVRGIYNYIRNFISQEAIVDDLDEATKSFIGWAKDEIHEEWSVVKALERGYAIHNGQIPLGIRLYQLNLYETNPHFNKLLCTSTLLEGVNTSAKNIIITSPSRRAESNQPFTAFDFFNLVGRTGRLYQHYIGDAYYLKAPEDPMYSVSEAVRSIKFEITDSSIDIDIQKGDIENHAEYIAFLSELNITHETYIKNIGGHFRFETIKSLYQNYKRRYSELIGELKKLSDSPKKGRLPLVKILYAICEGREDSFSTALINNIINRNRLTIHEIVDKVKDYFSSRGIDSIISAIIKLKTSYIEHQFYAKLLIIRYFMVLDNLHQSFLEILDDRIIGAIEHLYFSSSKQKKMLLDIGIYERDIDDIISIIGDDFDDVFEMKKRLQGKIDNFHNIGYLSLYIIRNL